MLREQLKQGKRPSIRGDPTSAPVQVQSKAELDEMRKQMKQLSEQVSIGGNVLEEKEKEAAQDRRKL